MELTLLVPNTYSRGRITYEEKFRADAQKYKIYDHWKKHFPKFNEELIT